MSTAQDFVPQEADIDVEKAYFLDGVKNLADNEDIAGPVTLSVSDYEGRFQGQRDVYVNEDQGIWNQQDSAFRCCINDSSVQAQKSKGANEPEVWERAKTATTQFYRQVRQKAANGYAVQSSKDMPFKYSPLYSDEDESPDVAEKRADTLNKLAKWSMKMDGFDLKSIDFWTMLGKYGNIPVLMEWVQRMGKKKVRVPVFGDDGVTIESYDIQEFETAVENRPVMTLQPIESVMLDATIGDVQRQECVIISSVVSMTDIVDGIRTGLYREDLLEDLGRAQQWDGYSGGFDNEDEKKDNRGFDDRPSHLASGQYLKREVFVNLPIDEKKETYDPLKNIPVRYRVTMFGNTPTNSALARVERNQEPDDKIPMAMIHANPDDQDLIYHISDYEVIQSNIATETTLIRQVIDNNTLVNHPPTKEVRGEVDGNGVEYGPNARYIVDNQNSIAEMGVRDVSQPTLQILEYMKDDSNKANSLDPNMIGESFGARTSASEASTIAGNSRRPNLVNIEYILQQFLGFVAERYKVLWEAYGRRDQVVQITDEDDKIVFIRPTDISGEYDIVVDIMDDIKDKTVESQKYINYVQTVGSVPQLAQTTDWKGLHEDLAEKILGTSKYVVPNNEGDAKASAMQNVALMLNNGQEPQLDGTMNLKKHLEIYQQERMRWQGFEDQNPNVAVLDRVIQSLQQMVNSGGQNVQAQATGAEAGVAPAEAVANGQAISAAFGG